MTKKLLLTTLFFLSTTAALADEADDAFVFDEQTAGAPAQPAPPQTVQAPVEQPPAAAAPEMIQAPGAELPKFATEEPQAAPSAPIEDLADDAPLPSPTEHFEAYEHERLRRLYKKNTPHASINLVIEPNAFHKTDFKLKSGLQLPVGRQPSQLQPQFKGIIIGYERMLGRRFGIWSVGINGGIYGSSDTDGYTKLTLGLVSAEPFVQYSFTYFDQQWFAPYVQAGLENIYQNYGYEGAKTNAFSRLARAEGGLQIYLNFLERMQAGQMDASFGIKRTYLFACMTYAKDLGVQNVTLAETTWRAGFRFEY